jgi:hypothetical protein
LDTVDTDTPASVAMLVSVVALTCGALWGGPVDSAGVGLFVAFLGTCHLLSAVLALTPPPRPAALATSCEEPSANYVDVAVERGDTGKA